MGNAPPPPPRSPQHTHTFLDEKNGKFTVIYFMNLQQNLIRPRIFYVRMEMLGNVDASEKVYFIAVV